MYTEKFQGTRGIYHCIPLESVAYLISICLRYTRHYRTQFTYNCIQQSIKTTLKFCAHSIGNFVFFVVITFSLNLSHSNLTDRHIKSLEFNVLDSLNTKLVRPVSIPRCQ